MWYMRANDPESNIRTAASEKSCYSAKESDCGQPEDRLMDATKVR